MNTLEEQLAENAHVALDSYLQTFETADLRATVAALAAYCNKHPGRPLWLPYEWLFFRVSKRLQEVVLVDDKQKQRHYAEVFRLCLDILDGKITAYYLDGLRARRIL